MNKLCIIPARGGSKRIPRKNIKLFLNKPIIAYSIEAAINSELFDEVMVSTDDMEIAQIALKYGAIVPFMRSSKVSNDFATTYDVIEEVLNKYKDEKKAFDYACCIYACAPLISVLNLKLSFEQLILKDFDSIFPIVPFGYPIQRSLKIRDEKVNFIYPEYSLTRSQDLEEIFHDAGQFYWVNTKKCLEMKQLVSGNSGSIILSELETQDIDNEVDWKLAELKFELLKSTKKPN
jgi:pseudaminic acid cytidylyltransferase